MDAKTKANFINSVAAGQVIPCPNCGTANKPDSNFCVACGTRLHQKPADPSTKPVASVFEPATPAFEAVDPAVESVTPVATPVAPATQPEEKPAPAFASIPEEEAAPAKPVETVSPVEPEAPVVTEMHTDEISVFAEGLPEWDIVPPQVVVRRR